MRPHKLNDFENLSGGAVFALADKFDETVARCEAGSCPAKIPGIDGHAELSGPRRHQ